jgi:hypothetical protein
MSYVPARQSGTVEFERKLRDRNPQRQMVRTLIGTITLIVAVGLAAYIALLPQVRF